MTANHTLTSGFFKDCAKNNLTSEKKFENCGKSINQFKKSNSWDYSDLKNIFHPGYDQSFCYHCNLNYYY